MNVHQGLSTLNGISIETNNNANDLQQEVGPHLCFVLWQKSRFWKVDTERKSLWWRWGFADLFTSGTSNMSPQCEVCFTLVLKLNEKTYLVEPHCGFVEGKLSETFLSEKVPLVMGVRFEICREVCQSREDNFYLHDHQMVNTSGRY